METTVYVHLTEERGYYLPFRLGEHATVSETNTAAGTIFITVATWIAQFIVEVSSAIDRALTDAAIHQRARYLCSRRLIARHSAYNRPATRGCAK